MSDRRPHPSALPPAVNLVVVAGTLSRPPITQRVADGTDVLVLSLAVPPSTGDGPPELVPVVVPDPPPWLDAAAVGVPLWVQGRVRRRFFRAAGRVASPTEVVAERVVRGARRAEVRRHSARLARQLDP